MKSSFLLSVLLSITSGCSAGTGIPDPAPTETEVIPTPSDKASSNSSSTAGTLTPPENTQPSSINGNDCTDRGVVLTRFPDLDSVLRLSSDSDGIFVAGGNVTNDAVTGKSQETGTVKRISKDTLTMTDVWRGKGLARDVAPTRNFLFISAYDYGNRTGQLIQLDRSASSPRVVATWNAHGTCTSLSLGQQDDSVAWSYLSGGSGGEVQWISASGNQATLFRGATCQNLLPIADRQAYWLAYDTLMAAPIDGSGSPATVFQGSSHLTALALSSDQQYLFVAAQSMIAVLRRADGSEVRAIPSAENVLALAADDRFVYWYDSKQRSIMRWQFSQDGMAAAFICAQDKVEAMMLDGSYLYWLTNSATSRSLNRAALP